MELVGHQLYEIFARQWYLHGDCLTVTGKTLAENLANVKPLHLKKVKMLFIQKIRHSNHREIFKYYMET